MVMRIRLVVDGVTLAATLEDTAVARDFAAMLPLELTLEDYAATEKVSDLAKRLTTDGAPAGVTPEIGDIAYYAPWGNLALFYNAFRYSSGLVRLGKIESGVDVLRRPGRLAAKIEWMED